MQDTVHVRGLSDLQKFLDQLPAKLQKNVMRGALRAGAKIIEARAKALAPVGPPSGENVKLYGAYAGALRDSIRVGTRYARGVVTATIKAGGKNKKTGADVYYAHFVEYGTRPHAIRSKLGKALLLHKGRYVADAEHPGARPKPFMRPALDTQAQAAVIATAEYIKGRLATKYGIDTTHVQIEGDEI